MSEKEQEQQYPSLPQQGKNLSDAIARSFKDLLEGEDIMVGKFEQRRRYDICQACKHFNGKHNRCMECGCYLNVKTKFKSEECPIKKW